MIGPEKLLQLATVYGACMCAAVVVELFIEGFKGAIHDNGGTDPNDGISPVCGLVDQVVDDYNRQKFVESILFSSFYHNKDCFTR